MTNKELIEALSRLKVETGSLACTGCGHEHNCGIHGCAIIREAEDCIGALNSIADDRLDALTAWPWISVNDRLPEDEQEVLVLANGRRQEHIVLDNARELATFYAGEGWFFEAYPEWEDPQVTYWMPLPEGPEEV